MAKHFSAQLICAHRNLTQMAGLPGDHLGPALTIRSPLCKEPDWQVATITSETFGLTIQHLFQETINSDQIFRTSTL